MEISPPRRTPSPALAAPRSSAPRGSAIRFADHLSARLGGLVRDAERADRQVDAALRVGGALDAAQMLELQLTVYRSVERVQLVTKLVERGTEAIRTVLRSSG